MSNEKLHSSIAGMLKDMEVIFNDFGIDYYLVGAVARDIQLSQNPDLASIRKTDDVDFAVMLNDEGQFYKLKEALIATENFAAHPSEAIKLFYKEGIEVDLMPFGEIEKENRKIVLTDPTFILNMPGFKEIYPFVDNIEISKDLTIKVCTLEGIILLKLISHNDRPQRTKDITDIEHIINVYFDLHDGQIYKDHFDIMDIYDTNEKDYLQLVCSRVIGRKLAKLLIDSDDLKERIKIILAGRQTDWWKAMLDGIKDLT